MENSKYEFFELITDYIAKNEQEIYMKAIRKISDDRGNGFKQNYLNFLNLKNGDTERFFELQGFFLPNTVKWRLN